LIVTSAAVLSACTTLKPVPLPEGAGQRPDLQVGDYVRVTTRNTGEQEFKITSVDADALRGPYLRITYREISKIEVRRSRNIGSTVKASAKRWLWCPFSSSC
jgi:hypothetical protein